ncbi:MAG: signal peptidase I [Oscillospiraceae bacterium]|nr:signal peptidase I [Oscillospiraceae bacterium]
MSDSPHVSRPDREEDHTAVASCFEWLEALITALIVVMLVFVFLFRLNIVVQGPSMQPNYWDGYRVFVSCTDRSYQSGDVVVIDAQGTRLKERLIKRVIATGGQTVNIDFQTGMVYVDGKKIDESAYIQNGITKNQYDISFPQKVPAGHVFVLGDNRTVSEDSRSSYVGMIDSRFVLGRVLFTLSPFHGFTAA